ncbi:MAG: thiamine pyrophosphate-binding protein [Phycisphaerae bacterium]|nr:thiamine pyrophosphate-binding protein [Phycisphaerae bacterium]
MAEKAGRFAIIEQFLADGMNVMFGNPGTVEQGFLDAIDEYANFKYILSLQEAIAVGMADGYARATKKPTVVQLHSGVGLGNGIGMMYQAYRGHAPLVIIASESGIKYDAMDAQMAADLVGMAKPVTKWATRVVDPNSVLRVLRRAIKIAGTPPMGPVFVCLPADVLDAANPEPVIPTVIPSTRIVPQDADIAAAAKMLAGANKPLLICGDGVAHSRAQAELTRLAEQLGADVYGADSGEVNMPYTHPLWKGKLGHMFGANSASVVKEHDVVLVVGTYLFPEVFPFLDPDQIFAPDAKLIHIDLNPYEIGKNFTVDLGMVADPKLSLDKLAAALAATMTATQQEVARTRLATSGAAKEAAIQAAKAKDAALKDSVPVQASAFLAELARYVDDDVVIFDEGLTTTYNPLPRYIPPSKPDHFFLTRGGSLGVGIPGALGLKVAYPNKTVIGFTGDGGSMYTIQALWTAAHYNIGAKLVICNNQSYMLLKLNLMQYWREQGLPPSAFPESFDLGNPVVDFVKLAESMGVPGARIETPDQIAPVIKQMMETDGPFLIDLVVSSDLPDASSGK